MKKHSLFIFCLAALILNVNAQLSHVIGTPDGFASLNGGTKGGEGGPMYTVTNEEELKFAVDGFGNGAAIVLVKGTIQVSGEISARGNRTIVGLGTDAKIVGGGFGWNTKNNVIVQNITFEDAPDDLLKINNKSYNYWIDHCTFSDGASTNEHDGMLDVTRASNYVTISYCHFFNHDKNNLIGHSDGETGDKVIQVTIHHCYFNGTKQRNPRVRYATVHCYNNYLVNNSVYGIASACDANLLVENCYFKNTLIPLQVGVPEFSPAGYLVENGCYFENCGTPQTKYKDMTGLFPYSYTLDSVKYVPCIAQTYAGAAKPQRSTTLCGTSATGTTTYSLIANATYGSISKSPDKDIYLANETVTLTATAANDYTFSGWSGDLSGSQNPVSVTMLGNKTITAVFVESKATTTGGVTAQQNQNAIKQPLLLKPTLLISNNIIRFSAPVTCPAEIKMIDLQGNVLAIPFRGYVEGDVLNSLAVNLNGLSNGVYVCILQTGKTITTQKFIVTK